MRRSEIVGLDVGDVRFGLRRTIAVNLVETLAPIRDGIMIEKHVGGPGAKKKPPCLL